MPDCMATTLRFGGRITTNAFEAVLEALDEDGVAIGDIEGAREDAARHEIIEIQDAERPWGVFLATEATLEAHGIPYERHSEAKYEHAADLCVFNGTEKRDNACSAEFEPVASLREIREALATQTVSALVDGLAFFEIKLAPTQLVETE